MRSRGDGGFGGREGTGLLGRAGGAGRDFGGGGGSPDLGGMLPRCGGRGGAGAFDSGLGGEGGRDGGGLGGPLTTDGATDARGAEPRSALAGLGLLGPFRAGPADA